MTTCHRHFLEARCRERGYTLDEVMGCVVKQDGDQWTIDTGSEHYPRAPKPGREPVTHKSPGLGDMVAAGLSAVGITKERVSALVGGDCGCQARQDALNRLGHKLGIGGPLVDKPPTAD